MCSHPKTSSKELLVYFPESEDVLQVHFSDTSRHNVEKQSPFITCLMSIRNFFRYQFLKQQTEGDGSNESVLIGIGGMSHEEFVNLIFTRCKARLERNGRKGQTGANPTKLFFFINA